MSYDRLKCQCWSRLASCGKGASSCLPSISVGARGVSLARVVSVGLFPLALSRGEFHGISLSSLHFSAVARVNTSFLYAETHAAVSRILTVRCASTQQQRCTCTAPRIYAYAPLNYFTARKVPAANTSPANANKRVASIKIITITIGVLGNARNGRPPNRTSDRD